MIWKRGLKINTYCSSYSREKKKTQIEAGRYHRPMPINNLGDKTENGFPHLLLQTGKSWNMNELTTEHCK
jgi:hypothetical protein